MRFPLPLTAALLLVAHSAFAQSAAPAEISGVRGVKQEAVPVTKPAATPPPPTSVSQAAQPPPPPTSVSQAAQPPPPPTAVAQQAQPPPPPTAVAQQAQPPPPPTSVSQAAHPPVASSEKVEGVKTIDGVKATGRNAIVPPPPPPPPPHSTNAVQAVKGITGLDGVKRENLEKALAIKEPNGAHDGPQGKAAAAALIGPPNGKVPAAQQPQEDGRSGFQEFEKLTTTGS